MTREERPQDPYASPPAPKSKGGPLLRLAIVGVLLGGAALGYAHLSSQTVEPLVPAAQEDQALIQPAQQMADASDAIPESAAEAQPAGEAETAAQPPEGEPVTPPQDLPPPSTTLEPSEM